MTDNSDSSSFDATARTPDFVEKMGDYFDRIGQPRIAGRLLGWLLVCDPPEQSALDLMAAVGASQGSISSMMRLLVGGGMVERFGRQGSRRTWFRIREGALAELLVSKMQEVALLRELADDGIQELRGKPGSQARLREMRDFYTFFEEELPKLVERYRQSSGRSQPA